MSRITKSQRGFWEILTTSEYRRRCMRRKERWSSKGFREENKRYAKRNASGLKNIEMHNVKPSLCEVICSVSAPKITHSDDNYRGYPFPWIVSARNPSEESLIWSFQWLNFGLDLAVWIFVAFMLQLIKESLIRGAWRSILVLNTSSHLPLGKLSFFSSYLRPPSPCWKTSCLLTISSNFSVGVFSLS